MYNLFTDTYAAVTSVVSDTELSLDRDLFPPVSITYRIMRPKTLVAEISLTHTSSGREAGSEEQQISGWGDVSVTLSKRLLNLLETE